MSVISSFKDIVVKELSKAFAKQLGASFEIPSGISEKTKEKMEAIKKSQEEDLTKLAEGFEKSVGKNFDKLDTNMGLLVESAKTFVSRIAMIPPAIISATPVGPGVSINMIFPMIAQLKSDAQNLGKVYDDAKTSFDDLLMGLDIEKLPEGVKQVASTIDSALDTSGKLLSAVGVSRGGYEKSEPEVESPMKVEASECDNYRTDSQHSNTSVYPKSPEYCTKFEGIMGLDNFKTDESGTKEEKYQAWLLDNRKCACCKNFKK